MKALVTGAAAGLGRALAVELARKGHEIVAVDRDEEGLKGLARDGACKAFILDIGDLDSLDNAIGDLAAEGPFRSVILNAGISATGRFEAIPVDVHRAVVNVDATASMLIAAGLARHNAYERGARLIFVSSLSVFTGYPGAASYAAAKQAIAIYARSIEKPFAKRGISVTTVFPGPLRTEHAARHAPSGTREDRRMAPERAARAILGARPGKRRLVPGAPAKLTAVAGSVVPSGMTAMMRRLIFDRLDKESW